MERVRHSGLSQQMKKKVSSSKEKKEEYDGNFGKVISTGSTLLDLAISGGRIRGGGLPGGILVEIFGPSMSGKTVLLSEIAGDVQRKGGEIKFRDPEARLNKQFAKLFGLDLKDEDYSRPNTIPELFGPVRSWKPKSLIVVNGYFGDSLTALSTDMEMDNKDEYGMRRAKEFSEECRKTCRIIAQNNYLMVCSNQVRDTLATFGKKQDSPGGKAIRFYSSLRLETDTKNKITKIKTVNGKEVKRVIGVNIEIEVVKSSIWKPFRTAPVTIIFDYGIDSVRDNLQFIKNYTNNKVYTLQRKELSNEMSKAIKIIEDNQSESILKEEVIDLWEYIEKQFQSERNPKVR